MNLQEHRDLLLQWMSEPLDPELEPYVENIDGIEYLRHPLVYQMLKVIPGQANAQLREKKKAVELALKNKEWRHYVWLHERAWRLHAFTEIHHHLSDNHYWELLSSIWIDSENMCQNYMIWKQALNSPRSGRRFFMDKEDRELFDELPGDLIIYRGCEFDPEKGLSWTLNPEKALWFAERFHRRGKVHARKIRKEHVFAYLTYRGEQEIVVHDSSKLRKCDE